MPWPVEPGSRNGIRIAARSVTAPSGFGGDTLVTLHRPRTASIRWERHPLTASWSLQVTPAAAFQARQLVSAHCVDQHPCVDADSLQTALLLVSELVTNAVRHGTGSVELGLTHSDELFRVYVSDQSNDLPIQMQPERPDETGRGLLLVQELATRWGVTPCAEGGKTVWCELPPLRAWGRSNK